MIPYRNKYLMKISKYSDRLTQLFIERYFKRHVLRWIQDRDFQMERVESAPLKYIFHFPAQSGDVLSSVSLEYYRKTDLWRMDFGGFSVLSEEPRLLDLLTHCRGYLLCGNVAEGDIILDVGAYDGWMSCVFCGFIGKTGMVYSLEPTPGNCDKIVSHMTMNAINQITIVPMGLSHYSGKAVFCVDASGMASESQAVGETRFEFDVIALTDLLNKYSIDQTRLKLIKVDIEGGELDCADDILLFIKNHPEAIAAIASYHIVDGQKTAVAIEQKCSLQPDLHCITLWPQHLTTFILHKSNQTVWQKLQRHAASSVR